MAKNIQSLAKMLGATVVGSVPDYSAGASGVAVLANEYAKRNAPLLSPSGAQECSLGREPQEANTKNPR